MLFTCLFSVFIFRYRIWESHSESLSMICSYSGVNQFKEHQWVQIWVSLSRRGFSVTCWEDTCLFNLFWEPWTVFDVVSPTTDRLHMILSLIKTMRLKSFIRRWISKSGFRKNCPECWKWKQWGPLKASLQQVSKSRLRESDWVWPSCTIVTHTGTKWSRTEVPTALFV